MLHNGVKGKKSSLLYFYPLTQLLAIHNKRGQKQILDCAILEKTDTRLCNLRENRY